jgi:hypothetical protein
MDTYRIRIMPEGYTAPLDAGEVHAPNVFEAAAMARAAYRDIQGVWIVPIPLAGRLR